MMSEYEVTVYRTVQQSTVVTVNSDRPLTDTEKDFICMKGEDEAAVLNDLDWNDVDVQIEYDDTQVKEKRNGQIRKKNNPRNVGFDRGELRDG